MVIVVIEYRRSRGWVGAMVAGILQATKMAVGAAHSKSEDTEKANHNG
jgi:hypothetical protein